MVETHVDVHTLCLSPSSRVNVLFEVFNVLYSDIGEGGEYEMRKMRFFWMKGFTALAEKLKSC